MGHTSRKHTGSSRKDALRYVCILKYYVMVDSRYAVAGAVSLFLMPSFPVCITDNLFH